MKVVTMGSLTARITGGSDGQGGGDGPVIVLLHGFGASGTDLVGLAGALSAPAGTRFVFPEAPIQLPMLMPGMDSRAWWMIDIEGLQRAVMQGDFAALRSGEPPGMAEARNKVEQLLDAVDAQLRPSKTILGGFSQGAIVSLDVALQSERPLTGLLLFSAAFFAEGRWVPAMKKRAGLKVFQSHGTMDPVLPYVLADGLRGALEAAGVDLTFVGFGGGHEIGVQALSGAQRFLIEAL